MEGYFLYLKASCYLCISLRMQYIQLEKIGYFIRKKFKAETETKISKFKLKMFLPTTYQAANVLCFTVLFLTYTQVFANQTYL